MNISINSIELFLLVFGSGGFGALITGIITQIFFSRRAKNEREFSFKKEQYLLLQKNAERVFEYIYENDRVLRKMLFHMKTLSPVLETFKNESIELAKKQIYIILNVYFPFCREFFDEYATSFMSCTDIYFKSLYKGGISEAKITAFRDQSKELFELKKIFMDKVLDHLCRYEKSVI